MSVLGYKCIVDIWKYKGDVNIDVRIGNDLYGYKADEEWHNKNFIGLIELIKEGIIRYY